MNSDGPQPPDETLLPPAKADRGLELIQERLQPDELAGDSSEENLSLLPQLPAAETASGLHSEQINVQDLQALQALLKVQSLSLAPEPCVIQVLDEASWRPASGQLVVKAVELKLAAPRNLKLHIAALPQRIKPRSLRVEHFHIKQHRLLDVILRQPMRRSRIPAARMPPKLHSLAHAALVKHFGKQALELELDGAFAHVPPELKEGLRLSADGNSLGILIPKGFNPAKATPGHYLLVLHLRGQPGAETRRVLLRL